MKDFIGVRHKWGTILYRESVEELKRDALIFSRIAIPGLYSWLYWGGREPNQSFLELKWLVENGIVFDPEEPIVDSNKVFEELKSKEAEIRAISQQFKEGNTQHLSLLAKGVLKASVDLTVTYEYLIRIVSAQLRETLNVDASPVLLLDLPSMRNTQIKKNDVMNIALNTLPIPSPLTSWEQILEYRSDPDAQGKFLALRNWANEVARSGLTPVEVEEKLEWLLYDYRKHLELHKMKTDTGILESVVVTGIEMLEDIVKLNWSKAAKALFSIKHRKVDLLETELKSPGREIAYIYNTQQKFSKE
jgi:hypothetical protein